MEMSDESLNNMQSGGGGLIFGAKERAISGKHKLADRIKQEKIARKR